MEKITLGTMIDGQLEEMFQYQYPRLISGIDLGESGEVVIKINFEKSSIETFDISAKLEVKFPKRDISIKTKYVKVEKNGDELVEVDR